MSSRARSPTSGFPPSKFARYRRKFRSLSHGLVARKDRKTGTLSPSTGADDLSSPLLESLTTTTTNITIPDAADPRRISIATRDDTMAPGNIVVGLLGGGQLGRMLCEAANPLAIDIAVLDADGSPAKQAHDGGGRHLVGSFTDPARIRELAARSDYLTVEIEHVDTAVLEEIERDGVSVTLPDGSAITHRPPMHPSWQSLRLIQDKFLQKEHFRTSRKRIPVAEHRTIRSQGSGGNGAGGGGSEGIGGEAACRADLEAAGAQYGYPFMLKARKGSYDGRGNFRIGSKADIEPAIKALGKLSLYAEKWAPFVKELSVMVVRTDAGCVAYPAVETIHEDSICTKVFTPPRQVSETVCERAKTLACEVVSTLWGRGVFAVEMFLLTDSSLMVNEVAPRPHNSGHLTIETVPAFSQFKAQLHAVIDLPVPAKLTPRVPAAIMLNILGGAAPNSHHRLVRLARSTFADGMDVHLHLYGKDPKPGRKIGHITLTGFSTVEALERLAAPMIEAVDEIRRERVGVAPEQLRPAASQEASAGPVPATSRSVSSPADLSSPTQLASPPSPPAAPSRNGALAADADAVAATASTTADGKQQRQQQPKQNGAAGSPQQVQPEAPLVLVTMGSDSDLPVLAPGLGVLREFGVPYELDITSAHRTPKRMMKVAAEAAGRGLRVVIAAAGGAAHLPGMLSSETTLPVIGVPVKATNLDGMDSLLSIVQMPKGVPTATVGINNSTNAALLAVRILGTFIPEYQEQMERYQADMEKTVLEKAEKLKTLGDVKYLAR